MRCARQRVPVLVRSSVQRGQERDLDFEIVCDQYPGKRRDEAHVADERGGIAELASLGVTQADRPDRAADLERRCQQVRMERQQPVAPRRRALGKYADALPVPQMALHGLVDRRDGAPLAPLDEERAGVRDHAADNGPAHDLRLRHEATRHRGVDREDVDPGDVIREQQAPLAAGRHACADEFVAERLAADAQAHAAQAQHPARPPVIDAIARGLRPAQRKCHERDTQSNQDMRHQQHRAQRRDQVAHRYAASWRTSPPTSV